MGIPYRAISVEQGQLLINVLGQTAYKFAVPTVQLIEFLQF